MIEEELDDLAEIPQLAARWQLLQLAERRVLDWASGIESGHGQQALGDEAEEAVADTI
ncbi:MAG: hypothetical protein M5U09_07925 [Gammaproteobacteria bacterium]|nr:hypothetical protein [Gammaproteobacteria bacterium]